MILQVCAIELSPQPRGGRFGGRHLRRLSWGEVPSGPGFPSVEDSEARPLLFSPGFLETLECLHFSPSWYVPVPEHSMPVGVCAEKGGGQGDSPGGLGWECGMGPCPPWPTLALSSPRCRKAPLYSCAWVPTVSRGTTHIEKYLVTLFSMIFRIYHGCNRPGNA